PAPARSGRSRGPPRSAHSPRSGGCPPRVCAALPRRRSNFAWARILHGAWGRQKERRPLLLAAMDLKTLGWDEAWERAFAETAEEGNYPARVLLDYQHIYRLGTAGGEKLGRIEGRMRHL